ncbi:hypothetical protein [Streptomyces sp. NPDC002889]|uniref:hypothetical protein n=1 Tax=Streptomyces sp. NPDC002889 TaxID=3364669 RepID=UPI003699AAC1
MTAEYRPEGFEDSNEPLPRDMPDQQAETEESSEAEEALGRSADEKGLTSEDLPDIDEPAAGPRGAPDSEDADADQPVPDEPTD